MTTANKMIERDFDHKNKIIEFFLICFLSVTIGLFIGGTVDSTVRKMEKDEDDWRNRSYNRSLLYFVLQASINIAILILFTKSSIYFMPWLQLSISGALFAVLLFTTQRNLVDNALRITNY
jgi:hypothetical protein